MRLLTLSNENIINWVNQLEKESKALKQEILKICWYMRGGITYSEAMQLSFEERKIIGDIVNDNFETTKKTGLPLI